MQRGKITDGQIRKAIDAGSALVQVLRGTSDENISFDDLCQLIQRLGFTLRIRGSHYIFDREDVAELINLQKEGSKAKSYQVRQVRRILVNYRLGEGI